VASASSTEPPSDPLFMRKNPAPASASTAITAAAIRIGVFDFFSVPGTGHSKLVAGGAEVGAIVAIGSA